MSQRNSNQKKPARLAIKKETLRQLQLRPLSDAELNVVAGGVSACCTDNCCAPSCHGC